MGRAQRNPSSILVTASDGFHFALPILRAGSIGSLPACAKTCDMRGRGDACPGCRSAHPGYKTFIRSPFLTIFWHCGRPQNSSRTGPERRPGNEPSMVLAENRSSKRVWQFAAKSLEFGVERPRLPPRFRLRPRPPCFLAGFCFLSAPEGRLGVCAWALRGFERDHQTLQRPLKRRTTQKEFSK
jgi:hypothetical protein